MNPTTACRRLEFAFELLKLCALLMRQTYSQFHSVAFDKCQPSRLSQAVASSRLMARRSTRPQIARATKDAIASHQSAPHVPEQRVIDVPSYSDTASCSECQNQPSLYFSFSRIGRKKVPQVLLGELCLPKKTWKILKYSRAETIVATIAW